MTLYLTKGNSRYKKKKKYMSFLNIVATRYHLGYLSYCFLKKKAPIKNDCLSVVTL